MGALIKLVLKEFIRKKVYHFILFFCLVILFMVYSYQPFGIRHQLKVALDFSLSVLPLLGLFVTLFISTTLVTKDIETKRIYLILTRPISKLKYLLGKLTGVYISLLFFYMILGIVILLGMYLNKLYFMFSFWKIGVVIFLYFLEMMLVATLVVFLSMLLPQGTAITFTVFSYILFHIKNNFFKYALLANPDKFKVVLWKISSYIIPNFEYFNLKDYAVHNFILPLSKVFTPVIYFLLLWGLFFFLAVWAFNKKEF